MQVLHIDKIFEPLAGQDNAPLGLLSQAIDVKEQALDATDISGLEDLALNRQNACLHQKQKILEAFSKLTVEDKTEPVRRAVEDGEFRIRQAQ